MLRDVDVDVDVAIVFSYDEEPGSVDGVRFTHLFDDPMYLLSQLPNETLIDHRDSTWIAGCDDCRRDFVRICEFLGFAPRIAYISDDIIVEQALVAAGPGVTTIPELALYSHHAPGIEAIPQPGWRRRIYLALYGEPPDPPATAAFVNALRATSSVR